MSKHIRFLKIHEYLGKGINSSINILIYFNIRIFATHRSGYVCTFCNVLDIFLFVNLIDFHQLGPLGKERKKNK